RHRPRADQNRLRTNRSLRRVAKNRRRV
ncbi:uncharacterized protein METZ01_LOCUS112372, partial [marine metagenome]